MDQLEALKRFAVALAIGGLIGLERERSKRYQLAARRATYLAQTATLLDAALEPETTLVSLARLAVPTLADSALVDLVEEGGQVRRVEVVDIDPIRRQDADALRRLAPDLRSEGPFPRAIRTGQPVLLVRVPLGVFLPAGVFLRIGDQPKKGVKVETCVDTGCAARFVITCRAVGMES